MARGDPSDGLIFDAVRVRLIEIGEAIKAISSELLDTAAVPGPLAYARSVIGFQIGTPLVVIGLIAAIFLGARKPSRVELTVDEATLRVRITGKDALYAMSRGMTIPVESIKGISVASSHAIPRTGLRFPGTGIPGVLRAGSYGTGSKRDFWLVRQATELLVIELQEGEPYRRIVLEVPDVRAEALRLRPILGTHTGSFGG